MGEKNIQLPDGRVVSFPSSMSDDDIAKAIQAEMGQQQTQPAPQKQPSMGDIFTQPAQRMGKGMNQMLSPQYPTSPVAGLGNVVAGAAQMSAWPIAVASEGIKQMPPWMRALPGLQVAPEAVRFAEEGIPIPFTESKIPGLGAIGEFFGGHAENATNYLLSNLFGEGATKELAEPAKELGSLGGQALVTGAVGSGLKTAIPKTQQFAAQRQARAFGKIGELAGAGQNLAEAQRAGQFFTEFDIASPKKSTTVTGKFGSELASKGAEQSRAIVEQLNKGLDDIVNQSTEAGVIKDAKPILDSAIDLYKAAQQEFLPNKTLLRKMEHELRDLAETMDANGGQLTPRQIQDFKVRNNALLKQIYEKKSRGSLNERQEARESILLESNAHLRKTIETLHSDVGRINWTEGAGLDLANAFDKFLEKQLGKDPSLARGSGITSAAAGRRSGQVLFGLTELSTYAPFRMAYNRFLAKAYGAYAGTGRGMIRPGEIKPYQPGPDATKIGNVIPLAARNQIVKQLGGPGKESRFGPLRSVSDENLITLAKEAGLYENAPLSEAPVSRGGSMDVRGPANREQIRRMNK